MDKFKISKKELFNYRIKSLLYSIDGGIILIIGVIIMSGVIFGYVNNNDKLDEYTYNVVEHKYEVKTTDKETNHYLVLLDPEDNTESEIKKVEENIYNCTHIGGTYDIVKPNWFVSILLGSYFVLMLFFTFYGIVNK